MAKKKETKELFSSILYIVIGILLVAFRDQALNWAMTIAGVIFIVLGALDVFKKNYAGGAISLIIGIAILVLGWLAAKIVLLVLGILIAIKGIVALVEALKRKKSTALDVIFPALSIALGIMLAFGNGAAIVIAIAGILLAIDGVLGLLGALKK